MAEKYGTIPKKYTKAWWDYFWTYYKWYVIVAVFIVITVSITAYQKITEPRYDLKVAYAGDIVFSEEVSDNIMSAASPLCEDVDKNGEKSVLFTQMNFIDTTDAQYAAAMQTKLNLTIAEEDIYIYLLKKDIAASYIGEIEGDSCFIPLSDWYDGEVSKENIFNANGIDYGIKLSECKFFTSISQDFAVLPDTYLFVRYYPRKDQLERQGEGHKAAMALAEKFITN